jgi:pimeloyl-ACP methyl ester carboxylesterase
MIDGFWEGLETAAFEDMPAVYRGADLQVSGDPAHARSMFELDKQLMLSFTDWPDAIPASIAAQTLVVAGDRDVITPQHTVLLAATIPDARLLIVPGTHGSYLGELAAAGDDLLPMRATLPFLTEFLDAA